jgi:hypothetical protein
VNANVAKIYSRLDNDHLAKLALDAVRRNDKNDLSEILTNVSKCNYIGLDNDFSLALAKASSAETTATVIKIIALLLDNTVAVSNSGGGNQALSHKELKAKVRELGLPPSMFPNSIDQIREQSEYWAARYLETQQSNPPPEQHHEQLSR